MLRSDETATITLDPAALARARGPGPEAAFAPPRPPVPPVPPVAPIPPAPPASDEPASPAQTIPAGAGPDCAYCGAALPEGRIVRFCPHCGQDQTPLRCHGCEAELEPGWSYCIDCGRETSLR